VIAIRNWLVKALPWITGACVLVQLLSLRLGLLNRFFYDAMHADVQGIDYFSLPKAFLNLAVGRSAYATSDPPTYGPHFTWFITHPALAVWLGSWLSFFEPMTSYGIYTLLSLGIMTACAWLIARESNHALTRRLIWLLILGAFPTYWMLFVGNVQALPVLALAMLLTGIFRMTDARRGEALVLAGLLLSLFSKPVVLLMLPLLLLLKESRRVAARALAIYAVASILFEIVPVLNPEGIGLSQVAWLAVHPAFVRANMNFYTNHFQLNAWMRDNSVHWFNLIAQSGAQMIHVDIFSLPVFLTVLTGLKFPGWLWQLPTLLTLVLSVFVARIENRRLRMEAALLLSMATSLGFFLGYPTVWEYQYTGVLPVAALLLVVRERGVFLKRACGWMFGLAACAWLPSFYVFTEGRPLTSAVLTIIWIDRVLPVTLLFVFMVTVLIRTLWASRRMNTADTLSQTAATPGLSG
jgi:hypothetical protein